MNRLRILIVDDHRQARKGLRVLLSTAPVMKVVGEAANGWEATRLMEEQRPDVVLMDGRMPVMDGLVATRRMKERWPEIRIVVTSMCASHRAEALAAGADAFVVKGCPTDELLVAILDC
jgi:DNA-binding NarL/FixJ family response regulator